MGDLNADCSYFTQTERAQNDVWNDPLFTKLIDDDADTTVSSTDCAYDRLVCAGAKK